MNKENIFEPLKPDFVKVQDMGFVEPKIDLEKDWFFLGATKMPDEIIMPDGQWLDVEIQKEHQKKNGVETMGCTGFGTNNGAELIIKHKYNKDWNGSDRAINILADNTPKGNSPEKPAEVLRKIGICAEKSLPFENINSWNEFHSPKPLPQNLSQECAEWKAKYQFLHEWVNTTPKRLVEALKRSPVGISVKAWKYRSGMYYKEKGERDNHWCVLIGYEYGKCWYIFDTYDMFIKKLEWNYPFQYAKKYYVKKLTQDKPNQPNHKNMLQTVKFQTDNRIFVQNPIDTKGIVWVSDGDGTSEVDWNVMKDENFITPNPVILPDTDLPSYKIVNWNINGDFTNNTSTNPFIRAIKAFIGLLRKE